MLGVWHAQNGDALDRETYAARLDAIRAEMRTELGRSHGDLPLPAGTSGRAEPRPKDAGDADVEVHSGDWAIIKTRELDLPPLHVDAAFAFDFADPIFRLGNDYSKGIILATGYVGQRTANGLVTCLTDGHPGVSGGGVLDQKGDLVGIPIGRMQGDYRFSFILPLRAEMLRKVPGQELTETHPVASEAQQ